MLLRLRAYISSSLKPGSSAIEIDGVGDGLSGDSGSGALAIEINGVGDGLNGDGGSESDSEYCGTSESMRQDGTLCVCVHALACLVPYTMVSKDT